MFELSTREELNEVPIGSIVKSSAGTIACKATDTQGVVFGWNDPFYWEVLALPAVLLFEPGRDLFGEAITEAITSMYHPEFGTEWNESDGSLYKIVVNAQDHAWTEGFEACYDWTDQNPPPSGIWSDPPVSPYQDKY